MVLERPGHPLQLTDLPTPHPAPGQLQVQISACAVCRTDLHIVDGELPHPSLPLVPGHEIVGRVTQLGDGVTAFKPGDRVGIPWLGWTCGDCHYCLSGRENLCVSARFTGYDLDGGYAEYAVADARFCFPLPETYPDAEAAPLLCAGLIGYRSLVKAGDGSRLGIYGFGAAAQLITPVARHQGWQVYAFTRFGDTTAQRRARELGAVWAGNSESQPPEPLDAAIIFAPVGDLVPRALQAVSRGGVVVCGGIHMSDLPTFPYELLWGERTLCSVANLTRTNAQAFLQLAPQVPVRPRVTSFPLAEANTALHQLREGSLSDVAVLVTENT